MSGKELCAKEKRKKCISRQMLEGLRITQSSGQRRTSWTTSTLGRMRPCLERSYVQRRRGKSVSADKCLKGGGSHSQVIHKTGAYAFEETWSEVSFERSV